MHLAAPLCSPPHAPHQRLRMHQEDATAASALQQEASPSKLWGVNQSYQLSLAKPQQLLLTQTQNAQASEHLLQGTAMKSETITCIKRALTESCMSVTRRVVPGPTFGGWLQNRERLKTWKGRCIAVHALRCMQQAHAGVQLVLQETLVCQVDSTTGQWLSGSCSTAVQASHRCRNSKCIQQLRSAQASVGVRACSRHVACSSHPFRTFPNSSAAAARIATSAAEPTATPTIPPADRPWLLLSKGGGWGGGAGGGGGGGVGGGSWRLSPAQ
jgi:hypothetical protein